MERDNPFWRVVRGQLPQPNAAKLLGWRFVDYREDLRQIEVEYEASSSLTNPLGYIQGGMLTAMLDDCMGPAIYAMLGWEQVALTTRMTTRFLNPALPGRILGCARLIRRGPKGWYTSGQLMDAKRNVLVTGSARFKVFELPR
ncbi:PaaI family thioesterase [Pseudomonas xantholysinigenes]|uniref:PaaI family thioesterase n=1 Tax=Pseudomonas xantholysinigenes TaxID=2745490 RepID=A0A9E6Q0D6_9PSED|nr:PaaI family thioesterase [Pseudomonas xantholysinigenes]QXI40528.1 PaaI family thioesterase [Pseudomonas xantholysinigenes]